MTSAENHLEIYRKLEILNDLFLGIFRLKYQEEILLEQDDVHIGCGETPEPGYSKPTEHQFCPFLRFSKNLATVGWVHKKVMRIDGRPDMFMPVSYTHLTLPTIYSV